MWLDVIESDVKSAGVSHQNAGDREVKDSGGRPQIIGWVGQEGEKGFKILTVVEYFTRL